MRALDSGNPLQAQLAARLRQGGRFLLVDPSRSGGTALDRVGASDFGVLSGLASAQGYGSLTWGPYAAATGTHSQDDLDPAALAGNVFDSLDVRVLLTVPSELSVPLRGTATGGSGPAQVPGIGAPPIAGVGAVPSPVDLGTGRAANRWFGRALLVRSVTLELSGRPLAAQTLASLGREVRLLPAVGRPGLPDPAGIALDGSHRVAVSFRDSRPVEGLSISDPLGPSVRIARVVVTTRSGASFGLDGALSAGLTAPHWVAAGYIGPFAVFTNQRAIGGFAAAGPTVGTKPGLRARVVRSSSWSPTETVAITSAVPATILRSVADIPGWRATEDHDGRTRDVVLHRAGLVQSFEVPAGSTLVTFAYDPPGLRTGLAMAGTGVAGSLVLAIAALARSGRPSRSPGPGGPARPAADRARRRMRRRA